MSESYSVKAVLSATDNGFSSTLRNAMGAADSFGAKIKSGFNFGVLTGMGQQAFSAICSGISSVVSEVDASNAAWKTFEGNMKILGKSDKYIGSAKKELQSFAESTVYSSSDMAQTFAQLEAVGTKNTTSLVKGFGGLAAAAENPQQAMKTLSQQATQMAAKPTVAWADFKLMLEQTPAGMAAVAKEMGMTSAELVSKIQAGEVATDDFFAAIEKVGNSDGFSKLATEYKTVGQAMDGLQATLGNKLTPAFDVLSQAGIDAVSAISDSLDNVDAQALADKVTSAIDTIKEGVDIFRTAFDGVGESVGSAFSAIKEAMGGANAEFSKTDAMDAFKTTCEGVAGAIKTVAGFLEEHADTIAKVLPWVAGLAVAFGAFKVLNTVAPGLGSFVGGLALMGAQGLTGLIGKLFGLSGAQKAVGKSSATSAKQMVAAAKSFLMIGVGVLAIAAGFALLAQSAIALASAGWGAIAVMAGLVIAVAGLTIGMMAMMNTLKPGVKKLNAISLAFLAMGAAVLLIATGFALLAQSSIALANAGGGAIAVMVGMVAAIALLAVGAAALGTALTAGAVGFVAFGAAILLVGVGAVLAGAALANVAAVLPTITAYGLQGALAITALGGAMVVFAVGAALAGAAALVLGAGLLVVSAAVLVLAAGVLALSAGCLVAAAALAVISLVLPQIAAYGTQGATAILALGAALAVFAVGAGLAGAACLVLGAAVLVLGAGFLVASAGILLCAAGMAVIATGLLVIGTNSLVAAASFAVMAAMLPMVTANALTNAAALVVLAAGLTAFGAAALVAGAGALVLGAGIAVAAVGIAAMAIAVLAMSVAALAASGAIAVLSAALPRLASVSTAGAAALTLIGAALLVFGVEAIAAGAGALVAAAGITAFGAAMLIAAAGTIVMGAAIKGVSSNMKSIASNAKNAEKSLDSMQTSVDVVQSGLDALGNKAKSAMSKLTSAFDSTASKAKNAGTKVGTGFTAGMQSGLAKAPATATRIVVVVNATLMTGRAGAYSAGAYISQGFALGMLSQLGTIKRAAAQMAAAADAAVRAKAKIRSPSKVSTSLGSYWGEGFVNGISDMAKDAWRAAENLVSVPQLATPKLALAYGGELSSDYSYSNNSEYRIEVPLAVDGKEFARATATYTQAELNKADKRENRKRGKA